MHTGQSWQQHFVISGCSLRCILRLSDWSVAICRLPSLGSEHTFSRLRGWCQAGQLETWLSAASSRIYRCGPSVVSKVGPYAEPEKPSASSHGRPLLYPPSFDLKWPSPNCLKLRIFVFIWPSTLPPYVHCNAPYDTAIRIFVLIFRGTIDKGIRLSVLLRGKTTPRLS